MSSRMDKYKKDDLIPSRSNKNKELYKQVYNAYDEFENLIIPSNAREIDPKDLKKEITSRQDYRKQKELKDITNTTDNIVIRKENKKEVKKEDEVYDINELLNKAVEDKKQPELIGHTLSNEDYLKRLKLDNRKTNIEKVKEMYEDIQEESMMEDESLMKTANLSLEILSDLKSGEDTVVTPPMKSDEDDIEEDIPLKKTIKSEKKEDKKEEKITSETEDDSFYSDIYKFKKKDFENDEDEEYDEDDDTEEGNKFLFRILVIISIIILMGLIAIYIIGYFSK